ncbi:siderophore-interacting protein [Pseudomonas agarici]|uniref:siderophore-interacting protein n=1 Tax=Pseudomonas agarici TaxID=46677 RepID=UPI0002DC44ED|nr:siderophore-interacting protein [Pseudomonas agarici]NWB90960.1 siderophore-interacting protein [Pseudomonas agarici]NWC09675.1 siderophore-interacting protein [Pseudomonas agarici]SEL20199.1 NADPH-dependent ferric siderophore reductase, contains FAD-binding and SIP domains [Pseudomonas agarici]
MTTAASLATSLAKNLRKLVSGNPSRSKPYDLFDIELKQRITLSPSLTRFVFTGTDIALMRTLAPDQRVKLFFPSATGKPPNLPRQGDWQAARRDLCPEQQPPMRTYTIRALRPAMGELDIDFVLHGESGPASTWATHAQPGAALQIVAPNRAHNGDPGGYEWQPPTGIRKVLLIGDETALPALAGILEELADRPEAIQVQAFIEVPHAQDCLPLRCPPDTELNWLPRDVLNSQHGEAMIHAARERARLPSVKATDRPLGPLKEVDIDRDILWELAEPSNNEFYAWVAGESGAVMAIRKHLVNERAMDRKALTLMGYWRLGRTLA